jgi:hypothetical protein
VSLLGRLARDCRLEFVTQRYAARPPIRPSRRPWPLLRGRTATKRASPATRPNLNARSTHRAVARRRPGRACGSPAACATGAGGRGRQRATGARRPTGSSGEVPNVPSRADALPGGMERHVGVRQGRRSPVAPVSGAVRTSGGSPRGSGLVRDLRSSPRRPSPLPRVRFHGGLGRVAALVGVPRWVRTPGRSHGPSQGGSGGAAEVLG